MLISVVDVLLFSTGCFVVAIKKKLRTRVKLNLAGFEILLKLD
jgi:hypothetical protein